METVTKYFDTVVQKLKEKDIEFVEPASELIERIYKAPGSMEHTKAMFRRTDIDYTHPTPVAIFHVLRDRIRIWTEQEKKAHQNVLVAKYHPRGVDSGSDTETARFSTVLDIDPVIREMFRVDETVRGSMADIILIAHMDEQVGVPIQLATAIQSTNGTFDVHKTPKALYNYLVHDIPVLLIGMVKLRVAGLYIIMPTPAAKKEWAELAEKHGSMNIAPAMLGKKKTYSILNKVLQKYRYLHKDFKDGIDGISKNLDYFPADFLDMICDNYHTIVKTPAYLSSLFDDNDKGHTTEWAYNVSFKMNVADVLSIIQTPVHGGRGDMDLDFGGEFRVRDERKILRIAGRDQKGNIDLLSWALDLRERGKQGLHPLNVRTVTAFARADRSEPFPSKPSDIVALIVVPVITETGNGALRPDKPEVRTLHISCDVANRSEYFEIVPGKIAADAYPAHLCETVGVGRKRKYRIKAVFYYDQLKNNPEKLNEVRELYKLFAERQVSENAIATYEAAVTDELIEKEKKALKKK